MTEAIKPTQDSQNSPNPEMFQVPEQRKKMVRRTFFIGAILLIVSTADSISQYQTFGAWQILADAAAVVVGLLILLASFIAFSRNNYKLANFLMPFVVLAIYSPGDLFLLGVTAYNLISGILVFILAYFIFRPRNIIHWLRMGILHVVLVILFSNLNLFERFDISVSSSWQASLPIFTVAITILTLWQIVTNLEFKSLQTRLLLILVSLGFIPTLIASVISVGIGYQRDNQQAQNYLQTITSFKSQQINGWINQIYSDMDDIDTNNSIQRSADFLVNFTPTEENRLQLLDEIRGQLLNLQNKTDRYVQLSYVDKNGTILASTNQITEGINISGETGYPLGRYSTYLTPLSISTGNSQPRMSFYHPLFNADGGAIGMIAARINTDALTQYVSDTAQLGETGESYLVSNTTRLLTPLTHDMNLSVGEQLNSSAAIESAYLNLDSQTLQYTNYKDVSVIGTYKWIPELKSILIVEQSTNEAFQALRLNLIISIAIAIITLGVTITIAVITARNLSEPIQTLSEEASQVWKGDLKHIEPVQRADEIGELSTTLSDMTSQLVQTTENLEHIVAERTQALERRAKYLETTSQISRAITGIYDIDNLLNTVAHLISENFGFYHIGIFIIDETKEFAVLRASNSEGGWRMLARQHKLEVGKQGIVGYVTSTGESRIQQQVEGEGSIHYQNPDLPLTHSEMALPLKVGNEILGALDVQSTKEMAFSDEDVSVLQGLADAVAIAIQNTRLVQQLQESLETERRIYGSITQQAWSSLLNSRNTRPAFRADQTGTQLISTPTTEIGVQALKSGKTITGEAADESPYYPIAVPVTIRGGVIIGVVETKKPVSEGVWSREEIEILESVCEELGLALENARLFEDTQRKAQRDRVAAELATKIWASSDVENILQTAVRELGSALRVSKGTIQLSLPDAQDQPSEGRDQA